MDTLKEARRLATSTTRQRLDVSARRAALATARTLDVVQVVDVEADRTSAPVALWQVIEADDGARLFVLADWRRGPGGWVHHERRFDADGCEVDAAAQPVPHGRILVTTVLPSAEAHHLREALLSRWDSALAEMYAQQRAASAAALPPALRAAINGEPWEEEGDVDMATVPPTPLSEDEARAAAAAVSAAASRKAESAGLEGELAQAAIRMALEDVPTTDRDVAWLLSRLSPDVVRRAVSMADALRERMPPPARGE